MQPSLTDTARLLCKSLAAGHAAPPKGVAYTKILFHFHIKAPSSLVRLRLLNILFLYAFVASILTALRASLI